jgi:hypothetical protein
VISALKNIEEGTSSNLSSDAFFVEPTCSNHSPLKSHDIPKEKYEKWVSFDEKMQFRAEGGAVRIKLKSTPRHRSRVETGILEGVKVEKVNF